MNPNVNQIENMEVDSPNDIFAPGVDEINFLQTVGINIKHSSGTKQLRFILSLIIGDNLGLHSILGFQESFRVHSFCHFCLITQEYINNIFYEDDCTLRDVDNYETLLSMQNPSISGVKESCVFHKIQDFHIVNNVANDVMHDVLEGVCRYDVARVLHYFIYVKKFFTLSDLNFRIRSFNYGSNYSVNKPTELIEHQIKSKYIITTSSEMLCLINHLPMIIRFQILADDEYWLFLLSLKKIVNIINSRTIHENSHYFLKTLIGEYLEQVVQLFPEGKLKPKHHLMIHMPRSMFLFGPLWQISCMRNEHKNQEGKNASHSSRSRVNICRIIAIKHQLLLNYRLMNNQNQEYPLFITGAVQRVLICQFKEASQFIHLLADTLRSTVCTTKWVKFQGNTIKKNSVIATFHEEGTTINIVQEIILKETNFLTVIKQMHDCYFDDSTDSYKIYDIDNFSWGILGLSDIEQGMVTHMNTLSGGMVYVLKHWM